VDTTARRFPWLSRPGSWLSSYLFRCGAFILDGADGCVDGVFFGSGIATLLNIRLLIGPGPPARAHETEAGLLLLEQDSTITGQSQVPAAGPAFRALAYHAQGTQGACVCSQLMAWAWSVK
jgi:hypothetical protein